VTTKVTITGTGAPPVTPGRAGAGVLVQCGDVTLQFDAGRATALRLAEAGTHPAQLDAVFITHHHSDHITGLVDVVFCAWLNRPDAVNLHLVAPTGPATRYLERMLMPFDEDIAVRTGHTGRPGPEPTITGFDPTAEPAVVWSHDDVRVLARTVQHHPVDPAVAYRVETPDGVVVISGDTRVCDEVEEWARGCDVLVHEAFGLANFIERTGEAAARVIGDYHADSVALGAMAKRAEPRLLMVTHMVPPPRHEADKQQYYNDVRSGGFEGELRICDDLDSAEF